MLQGLDSFNWIDYSKSIKQCLSPTHTEDTMSRMSQDELKNGYVWNGYDYQLQVWVRFGIVQDIGNRPDLVGREIETIDGAQVR